MVFTKFSLTFFWMATENLHYNSRYQFDHSMICCAYPFMLSSLVELGLISCNSVSWPTWPRTVIPSSRLSEWSLSFLVFSNSGYFFVFFLAKGIVPWRFFNILVRYSFLLPLSKTFSAYVIVSKTSYYLGHFHYYILLTQNWVSTLFIVEDHVPVYY